MSLECFGKVYSPEYDFVSGCWLPPGGKECCYTMPELSDWWYWYPAGAYDRNLLLRRMITITANGWVAKMGLGPQISGDFPEESNAFIRDVAAYYAWAEEAIFGTEPGGLPQGSCNDGAYVVTTQREKLYYIHVLTPPAGNMLRIRDGGLMMDKAVNVKTGEALDFQQADGCLVFQADFQAGCAADADFIIRLRAAESRSIKTAAVPEYGRPLPAETTVRLNAPQTVCGLILAEDESAATQNGGWASIDNNRLQSASIWTSINGIDFSEALSFSLPGNRGCKQLGFAPVTAGYIRLAWASAQDTKAGEVRRFSKDTWAVCGHTGAVSYAKDPAGIAYVVLEDGSLEIHSGDCVVRRKSDFRQVFRGADGRIYAIDAGFSLYRENNGAFVRLCGEVQRADVAADGTIWRIFDGTLYRNDARIAGNVLDVAVGADGCIWYCGDGYVRFSGRGVAECWEIPYHARRIAAGTGIYILDGEGRVFGVASGGANVYIVGNGMAEISAGPDGTLYGVTAKNAGRLHISKVSILGQ